MVRFVGCSKEGCMVVYIRCLTHFFKVYLELLESGGNGKREGINKKQQSE